MPKRVLTKQGIRIRKGQQVVITRDTFIKSPRPKKEVAKRDKIEKDLKKKKVTKKKK